MIIEDPIIRKSREKIQQAINKKFQDEGTRIYVNDNIYQILEIICDFYDNNSVDIYKLPNKDESEILGILNRTGIHFNSKEYHCLKGVIQAILKERYRSLFATFPDDLPEKISANDIYGEYSFDDLLCLNDTDFRQLKRELISPYGKMLPTLEKMILNNSEIRSGVTPRYLRYDLLPYTKSLRRYQRLRILDEIMAGAKKPLYLDEIHHKVCSVADENGIDLNSLWKINSLEAYYISDYKRNIESIYKQDFLALAELIAPSDHQKKRRNDVYSFDGFGGRRYLRNDMSAFKLVIPSSLAVDIYKDFCENAGNVEAFKYWDAPLIYAIVRFGKYHQDKICCNGMYMSEKTHNMKYYKTGRMLDYNDDDFYDYTDLRSLFDKHFFE